MLGCCCPPASPSARVWVNWWTNTLTWGMPLAGPTPGDKPLTLVASALAGGDCIEDTDALRSGGTARVLGYVVKAPSTLGTFLRNFRGGHVR